MVRNASLKNVLAARYATAAPYGALFTADPGTTGTASGEVSGGSYARAALNWNSASNGAIASAATVFNVPGGVTIAYFGVTTSGTATTADVQDSVAVTSQTFSSAGTYTVTANYAQS